MSDNKKYYYLRLKETYFDSDELIVLESMPDGYIYSNILLKLYLRSLKNEGRLMFNNKIPFNSQMLAQVTRHQVGTVEKAVKIFEEMGLIEIMDNGAIYISDIHNFIGESSTEADRKRQYRLQIEQEKTNSGQMSRQISDKNPPELELELKTEKKIDIYRQFDHLKITEKEFNKLNEIYTKAQIDDILDRIENYKQNSKYKSLYITAKKWLEKEKPIKTTEIKDRKPIVDYHMMDFVPDGDD